MIGPPGGPNVPPPTFDAVKDVLRIEDIGPLTTEVIDSGEGVGTLVQNGAGSVFLVGVTAPLARSVDGEFLRLFDAS